jgi:hypothetical protein
MKLTRPERIGASQLIPGVGRTMTGGGRYMNDETGGVAAGMVLAVERRAA